MKRVRYVITALLAVLWMTPLRAQQPGGTIRGGVTDSATHQPLVGAVVTAGGHQALTQADGRFAITDVPAGTYRVQARLIGYAPAAQSVTVVGGEEVLVPDFALVQQAVSLSEIVVTGYGVQRAGNITGAVTQLAPDEFNPISPVVVTPTQLMQAKVAGVEIVDNNEPGARITVRIRGATSVNASSDPLYVIDGMPVGYGGGTAAGRDPLNVLNPDDIASITVLKDASAAAIYGANAANGVVLITTKSGTSARRGTQFEYSTSASASSVTRLPSLLSVAQFRQQVALDDSIILASNPGYSTRSAMLGSANTDWLNLISRTGYGEEQNLSYTSAAAGRFYRLSLGYLDQQGILKGTTTNRLSLGLDYDQSFLNDRLDVKLNLKGTRTNDRFTPNGALGNATNMAPTQPVYDPNNTQGFGTGYWDWNTTAASASNPVAAINLATNHGTTWRSVGNVQAGYHLPFLPALSANVNLGYDATETDRQIFTPSTLADQTRQGHGYLSLADQSLVNSLFEGYLKYATPLGIVPGDIDLTGGYSYSLSSGQYPFFQESNLTSNLLGDNGIPASTAPVTNTKNVNNSKLISFYGRLLYNLSDRYLVALSVRRDGSSRFGPSNAWGTFPAVSLGWRVSQEPFMRGLTALSDLKLRASWAKTGNQAFADYQQYAAYQYSNQQAEYCFGTQCFSTLRPSAVDPNIKWEATDAYDVGVDYGFLNERFSGSIDWYRKSTSDLIFTVPIAGGSNFSNYLTTNVGSMRNQGVEFSLTAKILEARRSSLGWTADFTVSHNTNELTSINPSRSVTSIPTGGISGGVGTYAQILEPGQPINSFYVCRQYYDPTTHKPVEGKYYYKDADSTFTGTCDARGLRAYHDPRPSWVVGHTSSFTYGNFDLGFTLRAYLGAYTYNNVASSTGYLQQVSNGGSPSNMSTSVLKTEFVTPQYLSDYYVEDASFLRMDNLTLGYTFRFSGNRMRVYASVQNVFTITGYSGVDPTAGLNGLDNNIYPRARTVTGGLSVRF
jgi:TonB-linked SusC/RagA family outer membrane protein